MRQTRFSRYLVNVGVLFFFSTFSAIAVFHIYETKRNAPSLTIQKIQPKITPVPNITRSDFSAFLEWDWREDDRIDITDLSFIGIEELYNTNTLLVDVLHLKKIRQVLRDPELLKNESTMAEIQTILDQIESPSRYVRETRDYFRLRITYDRKDFQAFVEAFEAETIAELKRSFRLQYLKALLSLGHSDKAYDVLKKLLKEPGLRVARLETILSKKSLRRLLNRLEKSDWIDCLVFFSSHNRQGTLRKLSAYTGNRQLTNLFLAEYHYIKKRYSRVSRLLRTVKDQQLLGFKKRLLYKIRIRRDKYDRLMDKVEELKAYPKIYHSFLLNAAKLSMKERADLSETLFMKYLEYIEDKHVIDQLSDVEQDEYWSAVWRFIWLNYRSGKMKPVRKLLNAVAKSGQAASRISAEYWLAKLDKRSSDYVDKHPFSYYYICQLKRNGGQLKDKPASFQTLFPNKKTRRLDMIQANAKILLKHQLVIECSNYLLKEMQHPKLNRSEKNFIAFIPMILSAKTGKYGQSIWRYGRMFKNYRTVQLPDYLSEIVFPIAYVDHVKQFSEAKRVDPFWVLALIKQESTFNARVVSPSRAHGLMQLIMKTAKKMARKKRMRISRASLFNPKINIQLGVEYLRELLDKYNGNIYYALAAYNAGDHRVDKWLSQVGTVPDEVFVEMIPFSETRNYVKLVVRNYHYYKFYYQHKI